MAVAQHEPARGVGDEEKSARHNDREDQLKAKWKAPLEGATLGVKSIVHPVCQTECRCIREGTDHYKLAADTGSGTLGLVHWAGGGCDS